MHTSKRRFRTMTRLVSRLHGLREYASLDLAAFACDEQKTLPKKSVLSGLSFRLLLTIQQLMSVIH